MPMGDARLTIGDVERNTGLTQRQIRYYERKGIVRPARSAGGHRLYTREDVDRLKAVAAWKGRGHTLAQAEAALEERAPARTLADLPAKDGFARSEGGSLYPLRGQDEVLRRLRERDDKR